MNWNGEGLKKLLEQKGCTISALATTLDISRPTIYSWMSGEAPKGFYLMKLCDFFRVGPEVFFTGQPFAEPLVTNGMPL